MGEQISFRDRTDEVSLAIPVPAGLRPESLSGRVQIPVDVEYGFLEAWSGEELLARESLDASTESASVELPIAGARVRDDVADVTLRSVLTSNGTVCPDWTDRSLSMRDAEVAYGGQLETPTALADFIPSVLERLEIYLPDEPSRIESEAAAELAAAASARFGALGLEVEVLPLDGSRSAMASQFTRRVELREGAENQITLVDSAVPTVQISGEGAVLAHQARSVSSGLRDLAVADTVTVNAAEPTPRALLPEASLDALGVGSVSARGVGTVTASFGIDQTRMGMVAGEVSLELAGTYSPPPAGSSGLLVVRAGDVVVDSWVADGSGIIDRTIVVPADAVGRYTEIAVSLQSAGAGTECGLSQPLSMQISGASLVELDEAAVPAPRGFDSLPQAFMPNVQVATGSNSLDDVRRAITLLTELQSVSASLLRPEWVSVDELVSGETPGILVASDHFPDGLSLPVELTGGRTLDVVGPTETETSSLQFYEDIDFASVQVVQDHDRAILVAASTSGSAELDRTLDWLGSTSHGWAELRGDVLFTAPNREPVELSTVELSGAGVDGEVVGSDGVRTALIIGSVALVVGIALAWIAWLATGRRRSGRQT